MKKSVILVLSIMMLIVIFSQYGIASFTYQNNTLEKSYVGGESISGGIKISLKNEPSTSLLTSNFVGGIELINLLRNNSFVEGEDYNCSFKGCNSQYKVDGGAVSSITLSNDDKKFVGFKLTGSNVEINSVKLSIASAVGPSCEKEVEVNMLGSNETGNVQSYNYVNETCSDAITGCYDTSKNGNDWAGITTERYCEKMTLPAAPAFEVGARIMDSDSESDDLIMEIYDSDWNYRGTCTLPANTQEVEYLSCVVPYSNIESSVNFVCISSGSNSASYKIDTEDSGSICGNTGTNFDEYVIDYDISATPLKYAAIDFVLNESTYYDSTGNSLYAIIDEYIDNNYARNCSGTNGCIIPLEIKSSSAQTISISNAKINYNKLGANNIESASVYLLDKENASISSGTLDIDISKAGLTLPITTTQKTLQLYLAGKNILKTALPITFTPGFSFDVSPKNVLVGKESTFSIITVANISSVVWNFGDDSSEQTTNNAKVLHRYLHEGEFTLSAEVKNNAGITVEKTFNIIVGDPKTAVETILSDYKSSLSNISRDISSYDSWIRNALNNKINITQINKTLENITERSEGDVNYSQLLNELIEIDLPKSIVISQNGKLPLDVGFNNIDTSYAIILSENVSLSESQAESLGQNIINWNMDNYNSNADYNVISKQSSSVDPIYTQYKITITRKGDEQKEGNLIIPFPIEQIVFKESYGQKSVEGDSGSATAIPITGSKTIELLLPGKVEIEEIGAYIAPSISEVVLDNGVVDPVDTGEGRKKLGNWLYVILAVGILVIYIILQEWYKKRYEAYLFKNRDDLYNIVNFIFNSRISRLEDEEIRKKLSTLNWKGEQLNYAFKKIDGKRTGLWELPIFKFIENRKVKKEIAKRQEQNGGGARFIKRPY